MSTTENTLCTPSRVGTKLLHMCTATQLQLASYTRRREQGGRRTKGTQEPHTEREKRKGIFYLLIFYSPIAYCYVYLHKHKTLLRRTSTVTFLEGLTDGQRIFREPSVSPFGLGRTRSQSTGPSVSVYTPT
jgi:hypothetical protein